MNKLPFFRLSASLNLYWPKTKQILLSNAFINNLPSFLPLEHARRVMSCSGLLRPRKILSVLIIVKTTIIKWFSYLSDYQNPVLIDGETEAGTIMTEYLPNLWVPSHFHLKMFNTVTYYPSATDYLFLYNQTLTSEIREYKCISLALFPSSNKFPSHSYAIKKFNRCPRLDSDRLLILKKKRE